MTERVLGMAHTFKVAWWASRIVMVGVGYAFAEPVPPSPPAQLVEAAALANSKAEKARDAAIKARESATELASRKAELTKQIAVARAERDRHKAAASSALSRYRAATRSREPVEKDVALLDTAQSESVQAAAAAETLVNATTELRKLEEKLVAAVASAASESNVAKEAASAAQKAATELRTSSTAQIATARKLENEANGAASQARLKSGLGTPEAFEARAAKLAAEDAKLEQRLTDARADRDRATLALERLSGQGKSGCNVRNVDFASFDYPMLGIILERGKASDAASSTEWQLLKAQIAYGDLNADGADEVVVPIEQRTAGAKTLHLVVFGLDGACAARFLGKTKGANGVAGKIANGAYSFTKATKVVGGGVVERSTVELRLANSRLSERITEKEAIK